MGGCSSGGGVITQNGSRRWYKNRWRVDIGGRLFFWERGAGVKVRLLQIRRKMETMGGLPLSKPWMSAQRPVMSWRHVSSPLSSSELIELCICPNLSCVVKAGLAPKFHRLCIGICAKVKISQSLWLSTNVSLLAQLCDFRSVWSLWEFLSWNRSGDFA